MKTATASLKEKLSNEILASLKHTGLLKRPVVKLPTVLLGIKHCGKRTIKVFKLVRKHIS